MNAMKLTDTVAVAGQISPSHVVSIASQGFQVLVNNRPDGAEPLNDFADRVWAVYQQTSKKYQGKHILMVGHAGVIRAITSKVLGMPLDDVYSKLKIDYAAIATTKITENESPVMVLSSH